MKLKLLILLVFVTSCCSDEKPRYQPRNLEAISIHSGDLGLDDSNFTQRTVLYDENEYAAFLGTMPSFLANGLNNMSINFSEHTLIALIDEPYAYQGHDIFISSVIENEFEVVVDVETSEDGPCAICPATQQAYRIFKIPNVGKPVILE